MEKINTLDTNNFWLVHTLIERTVYGINRRGSQVSQYPKQICVGVGCGSEQSSRHCSNK